jgi:hypothetical protein
VLKRVGPLFSSDRPPMMTVYRDKCLVMSKSQKKAKFLIEGKDPTGKEDDRNIGYMDNKLIFKIDQNRTCVTMLLVENQYVILVYENAVTIMNAKNGDALQDLDKFDQMNQGMKFKFKYATVNIENKNVFLVSHNEKSKDNLKSQVWMIREKPYEDQIQYLMGMCRINEAREIFNTRSNKSTDLYGERLKRFDMDAAWQLLKLRLDFKQVVSLF